MICHIISCLPVISHQAAKKLSTTSVLCLHLLYMLCMFQGYIIVSALPTANVQRFATSRFIGPLEVGWVDDSV